MNRHGIKTQYRIKGQTYRVVFVQQVDEFDSCGAIPAGEKVIKIKGGMSKQLTWETLLHELGHAVSAEIGLHTMPNYNEDQEDLMTEGISNELVRLFILTHRSYN